ncbi:MAG: Clp protease [Parcubacteria group bacterium ADurb.Bin326]|nr:MAG: Clp protease [Parcubacteria group bacterium ADurb.Bin326]
MLTGEQWELFYRRIIDLRGPIDATMFVYAEEAIGRLSEYGYPAIRITLESRGGDNHFAVRLYRLISDYPGKTTGIVPNFAFSGAVTVLQGCRQRTMAKEANLLIHRPYRLEESTLNLAEPVPEVSDGQLNQCFEELCLLYGGRSGRHPLIFRHQCLQGTLISSDHALFLGLVDRVIA